MYEEIEEALNHELEGDHDQQDFLCETTIEANLVNATNQLDLNIFNINRCGAHTLAIAIEDALKRDEDIESSKKGSKEVEEPKPNAKT